MSDLAVPEFPPDAPRPIAAWMSGGVWSVLDQGLFAGANFLVNVLLARELSPEAYGAFSVAFVVFLLTGAIHGGLFTEPMLVFGAGRFRGQMAAYLRVLLRGHVVYSLGAGAVLVGIGGIVLALGSAAMAAEFATLGVVGGVVVMQWMVRRACYVINRPDWAAAAGALYVALLLGGAFVLMPLGWFNGPTALLLMGAGSLVATAALAVPLGLRAAGGAGGAASDAAFVAEVREAHAGYGRWAAPTGGLEWLHHSLPLLVLPLFVGLDGSGTLRALYNLAMPALQAFAALGVMTLPLFVRARLDGRFPATARVVGGGIVALGVVYGAVLLLAGRPIVEWVYRGNYAVGTPELVLLALVPVAAAASGVLMAMLRSDEQPRLVFQARAAAVGVASTAGVAMTAAFSVAGALASDLLSLIVETSVQARALRRRRADAPAAAPAMVAARRPGRLRVLMNAYATHPTRGSELAVGWNVVTEMARHHDVWALVYEGFRPAIEAALAERPVPGLHLVYVQLPLEHPRHVRRGEQRHGLPEQLHYLLWQGAARRAARRLHREVGFDLAHHVTVVQYWTPTAVQGLGIPYIWGPVGGGESTPSSFFPALSATGRRYETKRKWARRLSEYLPGVRAAARESAVAFATTEETAARVRALGARDVRVQSGIGLTRDEIARLSAVPPPAAGPARFMCIGRLSVFKGFSFAVRAFARAVASGDPAMAGTELWIVGDGEERGMIARRAAEGGVADRVRFLGNVTRDEVMRLLGESHALVHPSLHDSGGFVCLEALAAGRPVLGLDLGGTSVHVGPGCGVLLPATDPSAAIESLAGEMRRLASDPRARARMGEAGHAFVHDGFVWEEKVAPMAELYWHVAGRTPPPRERRPAPVLEAVGM